ncbi:DegV family protein [Nevskia sp.]|uniref:DegV family protein n=1 Tax=Nevskia sp. TaxID=1929292 RepID=UPI0025DCBA58|nr:DegV family protein [Nevskia sp.]
MRIGLVVDSACDLPTEYVRDNGIVVLPITIRLGNQEFVDARDPDETQRFYRKHLANTAEGETAPYSIEQIKRLFLDRLVIDYDFVFCLTLASSRSPIFDHATRASFSILSEYKPIRQAAGHTGPFALRVVDTQNLFAAQGVLAAEVVRMTREGASPNRIRERVESLVPNLYGYMLPSNLYHLRARAAKKGDKSVGWLQYALGSALDIKPLIRGFRNETGPVAKLRHYEDAAATCFDFLIRRIKFGLMTRTLCVSYAGDLTQLYKMPGYVELQNVATRSGIELLTSVMSITGAINVGEGALAFGYCAAPHEFG